MTRDDLLYEIVSSVADRDGRAIRELPLLGEQIDVEAVQAAVESGVDRVEFEYLDYRVVVRDGDVELREQTE
ncbi:hypothetical protein Hbl1158_13705 [Halobaculum sp. CBA1158]|uniref:HalOD1 output domain-containing protein n=1 Tax=Halobaculum sp. CBA1158 TaxID=2904243 RepID=UPI001F255E27|nr:HalOD1 output domain-containing protein [Halobaculum sp. CBA1158]UIO99564.1 hypothetical protein Hbl1158_13705 [Halobaculum sp. CBA1158]